jgi:TRAP-type mannitol/chloroaromatic compound transport system permease small subunit
MRVDRFLKSTLVRLEFIYGQQRPTGTMPLVSEVGYVYALLPSVFWRIFCSSNGMSRSWADADFGRGAATATEAPAMRRET